jgi:holliday junction DNA helicase RuvA
MITHLSGTIVESSPTQVVIDVQGVGYELLIPSSSFSSLPQPGKSAQIFTHLAIRDDAHILYGFATSEERELFRLLINTVSGIGPRIGLNVLSGMSPRNFKIAVTEGNTKRLSQISGLGKKTAERIVVELKDKLGASVALEAAAANREANSPNQKAQDAIAALVALGYKPSDAAKRVESAVKMLGQDVELDRLVKASLSPTS